MCRNSEPFGPTKTSQIQLSPKTISVNPLAQPSYFGRCPQTLISQSLFCWIKQDHGHWRVIQGGYCTRTTDGVDQNLKLTIHTNEWLLRIDALPQTYWTSVSAADASMGDNPALYLDLTRERASLLRRWRKTAAQHATIPTSTMLWKHRILITPW